MNNIILQAIPMRIIFLASLIPQVYNAPSRRNTMTLREWMRANRVTQAELAERIGVTPAMVHQVLAGKKEFGKRNISKIVQITGGAVGFGDLICARGDE
jgi:predicted XRE-type DNA-binding protein